MNEIIEKKQLADDTYLIKVKAQEIAESRKTGQFAIFRADEQGERIPLTIADADTQNGTITIIFQETGDSTKRLGKLGVGDFVMDDEGVIAH